MLEIIEIKNKIDVFAIKELYKIHNKVFIDVDKLSYENFEREFYLDNRIYYMAIFNKKIIGYIGVINCIDFFEIIGIGVKEENQNNGIGTKLLKEVFNRAKKLKIEKIFLEVDEKNKKAQNFYIKNGFSITNIRKNYYKNNDAYIMMCNCF